MNRDRIVPILLVLLLAACAAEREAAPPSPSGKHGAWVDQFHEPRGRPYCIEQSGGVEDDAFHKCLRGWHERIWVEDLAAPGGKTN